MKRIKYILLGLLGFIAAILIWGLIEPYILDREPQIATIPNLPNAWEGQKIAVMSDWQVGMWLDNTPTVGWAVDRIIEERPAIALILGDFIYHALENPEREIGKAIDLVRPLANSGIPTYAVLGNHDYGMKSVNTPPKEALAERMAESLEAVGVRVLKNEAVALTKGDRQEPLYLIGIGAHRPNEDRPKVALAQVPEVAPRFVMMHNPDSFAAFPANTAPIAVAGHTHGGQIRLPLTPQWAWLTFVRKEQVHADGWIKGYGEPGNQLYVNRGIGFSYIPIRINCTPELTVFTLQASR